jgi:hypothetical protein
MLHNRTSESPAPWRPPYWLTVVALALALVGTARGSDAMDPRVAAALRDLANRLAIDESQIQLVLAEAVTWPDPSLGCPEPGMRYRQVPVDGYRILLRVADRVYAYHGGDGRGPFHCADPAPCPTEPGDPRVQR